VPLDEPDMRQAIAWQLCHRQMMHQQVDAAVAHFKQRSGADDVRDLQVRAAQGCVIRMYQMQVVVCTLQPSNAGDAVH
jgi:hypothetical protein